MADKLSVPANVDNPVILKRFLNQLIVTGGLGGSTTWNEETVNDFLTQVKTVNSNLDFLDTVSKIEELRNNIRTLVEADLETLILQNKEDVALIAEQYGTFYDQAQAASWYGLSVKAGGAVAGLEVGSLDPDVTTPGDESSYFRIIANNFVLGRAYEDLSVEEKAYLADNGLPAFGTVYNADKTPMPAIVTSWDNINKVYKHFFNGIVQFSNISGADYANAINNGTTTINGGKITTNTLGANTLTPSTGASTTWAGGGLVSQNFNGNAAGSIGSPTQGFRLSSNAAGTSADPTIFGAYIKGATLEGISMDIASIRVKSTTNSSNYGSVTSFLTSGYFYGSSYGSGYLSSRICSSSSKINVYGIMTVNTASWSPNTTGYLQYSISGGGWVTLDTARFAISGSSNAEGGSQVSLTMFGLIDCSIVPATGYITFQVIGTANQGTPIGKWNATLSNQ